MGFRELLLDQMYVNPHRIQAKKLIDSYSTTIRPPQVPLNIPLFLIGPL